MPEPARWSLATDEGAAVPEHIERWHRLAVSAPPGPAHAALVAGLRS